MEPLKTIARSPRTVAIACAIGAVALGLGFLAAAGAPWHYLAINGAALLIGLAFLKLAVLLMPTIQRLPAATVLLIPAALLATAFLGNQLEGVARWVRVGGISLQPGFALLPTLAVSFAFRRSAVTAAAVLLAAIALALQPDRAMAGALAAGLGVLVMMRPDRFSVIALAGSLIAFAATLLQPDMVAPVPYVEQVFATAFDVHGLAGAAVIGGAVLLLVPSIIGWHSDPTHRDVYAVFGAFWLATIVAALLGTYPTPIVGYGGSAILGYLLSLAFLPRQAGSSIWREDAARNERVDFPPDMQLRTASQARP